MKQLSLEEQKELINDWFDGKYFLEVKPNDYEVFIKFIAFYDMRYKNYKCETQEKNKYVVWRFSENLHHHQLEFDNGKDYWKGTLLSFDKIRKYVSKFTQTYNKVCKYFKKEDV